MDKLAAYNYIHAMSKAASVALRIKRATGTDTDTQIDGQPFTQDIYNNFRRIYIQYIDKPLLRDVALNQYARYLKAQNAEMQRVPISDATVQD